MLKGCDSNFEVKYSNFKSRYKWKNYHALISTWRALEIYNNNFMIYASKLESQPLIEN